ncbi:MAG: hypothetical protein MJ109_00505 [Kiritimatiellae bacterium]|nr:hypothetical protein [Kiritimatiellia bacterium]
MKKFEVNGMEVVDRMLREHGVIGADEVWVHGMWTPGKWAKCLKAKLRGKKLVRMTHGSLSPIYLEKQGKWKKFLVKPFEKLLFRLADKIVFTGEWEAEWFEKWMPGQETKFEVVDLKRYFRLEGGRHNCTLPSCDPLHVLYLGRRHPLKGVEFLEQAIKELNSVVQPSTSNLQPRFTLRIVSDHTGEALEKDWEWCEVLCLPTLSENFGLVVAEALERGKRVITTDGAPAWAPEALDLKGRDAGRGDKLEHGSSIAIGAGGRLLYLEGYRDGSEETRVTLLKNAIEAFAARRD